MSQQEQFEVKESRAKVVRQERVEAAGGDCFVELGGAGAPVVNYSPFGILVEAGRALEAHYRGARLWYCGVEVAALDLRKVRTRAPQEGRPLAAFAITGAPLPMERMSALRAGREVALALQGTIAQSEEVPAAFRARTLELKAWAGHLRELIAAAERSRPWSGSAGVTRHDEAFAQVVARALAEKLTPLYDELAGHLAGLPQERVKRSFDFFRREVGPVLYEAPFADRCFHKPLGYAGDFEMMNLIYRNEAEGGSLFAKCLHRYLVEKPAAAAVRNRSHYLRGRILEALAAEGEGPVRILSVASGPAREMQLLLEEEALAACRRSVELHLLDQDLDSLKHAQAQLTSLHAGRLPHVRFTFHHKAMRNLLRRGVGDTYDLVYSAGLFDYFSAPVAKAAGQRLFDAVAPGGRLVVGNFSHQNPGRFEMELTLDWHLIHRSQEELMDLFGHLPGELKIDSEMLGINLFANVIRPLAN
jgi:extracellular factor (EF) 3-hydroxypalmitic acid methyl ester biosynthesis protein